MARGRKHKQRPEPPRAEVDYSDCRVAHYHLCGQAVYAQPMRHRVGDYYYFIWFASVDPEDQSLLQNCPNCHGRINRASIRLPMEQYCHELAQEELALAMAREMESQEEDHA